jgi:hypothetical protein
MMDDDLPDELSPDAGGSAPRWALRNLGLILVVVAALGVGLIVVTSRSDKEPSPSEEAIDRVARKCDIAPEALEATFEGWWSVETDSYVEDPDENDQRVFFVVSRDPDQPGQTYVRLPGVVSQCPELVEITGGS